MEGHRVFETQDGTRSLFSERFGVSYHSKYGAWQETQHVFVQAGLRYAAIDRSELSILDIGFGTGLNCVASALDPVGRQLTLKYLGVDAYPVDVETLHQLDYPSALSLGGEDRILFDAIQELSWQSQSSEQVFASGNELTFSEVSPNFHLAKLNARFEVLVEHEAFDVVYYDAFAPSAQPELWTPERFEAMYRALRPGGILVTYCAKGQVKRDLRSVGFDIEALQGPPGKREMTRAAKPVE